MDGMTSGGSAIDKAFVFLDIARDEKNTRKRLEEIAKAVKEAEVKIKGAAEIEAKLDERHKSLEERELAIAPQEAALVNREKALEAKKLSQKAAHEEAEKDFIKREEAQANTFHVREARLKAREEEVEKAEARLNASTNDLDQRESDAIKLRDKAEAAIETVERRTEELNQFEAQVKAREAAVTEREAVLGRIDADLERVRETHAHG